MQSKNDVVCIKRIFCNNISRASWEEVPQCGAPFLRGNDLFMQNRLSSNFGVSEAEQANTSPGTDGVVIYGAPLSSEGGFYTWKIEN